MKVINIKFTRMTISWHVAIGSRLRALISMWRKRSMGAYCRQFYEMCICTSLSYFPSMWTTEYRADRYANQVYWEDLFINWKNGMKVTFLRLKIDIYSVLRATGIATLSGSFEILANNWKWSGKFRQSWHAWYVAQVYAEKYSKQPFVNALFRSCRYFSIWCMRSLTDLRFLFGNYRH